MLDLEEARDQLQRVFIEAIGPHPRRFGSRIAGHMGISDGNEGVQWNAWVDREPMESGLGVNLEGLVYDEWPIARFIQRELANPKLLDVITRMSAENRIGLTWSRDYWQRTARPPIKERRIVHRLPLAQLHPEAWRQYLLEARDCLDRSRGYLGRAKQTVTLAASGRRVEDGEVSPHLHFARKFDQEFFRGPHDLRLAEMNQSRQELEPLYQFVKQRSSR